jgi:hypothetical protein
MSIQKKHHAALAAAGLCALLAQGAAHAGGHYVAGVEGLQGSSVPPPGNYYLGYLVHYDIDDFRAPGTDSKLPGSNSGKVTALANRLVKITSTKLLGADYGFETIIPVTRTSLDIGAAGLSDRRSGVGDIYVGPLVLGWHGPRWDAVAAAGVWLDTGKDDHPASPGKGYRSTMLTGGVTLYLDEAKTVSASALSRFERNGRTDAGLRPGNQLTLEWGVGKQLGRWQAGIVGYDQWQLGEDSGPGASPNKAGRHAVGAELVHAVRPGLLLKGAAYKEYKVEAGTGAEPKGSLLRVSLVAAF